MNQDCPLCSVASDKVFFEGRLVRGIWDAFPVSPGHALLITRRHVPTWFDASPEERTELAAATEVARENILAGYRADGFNIGVNVGTAGGQTVPHLHLHVIPRLVGDVADPRGGIRHVIPAKGNYLRPTARPFLTTGPQRPLWPELRRDIDLADRVDIAVAFVMWSGVERLAPQLEDLLRRGGNLRLLTGDYLDVTEPRALKRFLDWQSEFSMRQVDLRVFETRQVISFHPKTFICRGPEAGVAYVGSSNLSRSALEIGIEWNYRVVTARDHVGFSEAVSAFDALFENEAVRPLTESWVGRYEARRVRTLSTVREVDTAIEPVAPPPEPTDIQEEALAALENTRARGNRAGLVVLATGLGKTWLSAFDADRAGFSKILFVAHREEILSQAVQTFRRIRPLARFGRYDGDEKEMDAEVLFASIQTIGRKAHLERFARDAFDYVVVDEFHHASARTYRKLIAHFEPKFLLGLTATPERSDGGDLLQLCGENLVFRCDLAEGVRRGLLCPFHYFGVPDLIDYANIPWRNGRFDEEKLTEAASTQARAANAFEQWQKHAQTRTLAFCVSQRHADFMADYFATRGVRCRAVHSGPKSAPRSSTLEQLANGELQVVFAVDMFNEGVDIPDIDTVLMLRPTESAILFLQQLGRGLRLKANKRLIVVDYIGNHRSFLMKPRTLFELKAGDDRELSLALKRLAEGELQLPPGCEVTYELAAVDLLRGLMRLPRNDDALRDYYEDFRERRGVRPTATEALHDGYLPHTARRTYGSWFAFVEAMGDLGPDQKRARAVLEKFLSDLEVTPMTKSYKMLVLKAMLDEDAFPGSIHVDRLTARIRANAERSEHTRADLGAALDTDRELKALLVRNPIDAWTGGRGGSNGPFFALDGDVFRFLKDVPADLRSAAQELTRELTDLRLAQYLSRDHAMAAASGGFTAKVSHVNGRPILFLPDRKKVQLPEGWTRVTIGSDEFEANFTKIAVNVLRRVGSDQNELPAVMRGWFGPRAGLPGTGFLVACEPVHHGYTLRPIKSDAAEKAAGPELWRSYSREELPSLFGATFSEAIWNAGFVMLPGRIVLLVTLAKGDLTENFQYADHFVSRDEFEWQSQNRTTQASKAGEAIRRHEELGTAVELFVRRTKKIRTGAAPFVYCGSVRFLSWTGERPITVRWKLPVPVPERLWRSLERAPADLE